MGMIIDRDGTIEYYSDINGKQLDRDDLVLDDGDLISKKQFYKRYGIVFDALVSDEQKCDECLEEDCVLIYIGIEGKYLCENCFEKWMEECGIITDADEIYYILAD